MSKEVLCFIDRQVAPAYRLFGLLGDQKYVSRQKGVKKLQAFFTFFLNLIVSLFSSRCGWNLLNNALEKHYVGKFRLNMTIIGPNLD